jgi:hypothetical protein
VYYIPSANVLITLPVGEREIVLRRVALPEVLAEQGVDYLYVDSLAPVQAHKGQSWRYQILAHASGGALSYQLESGPDGMVVTDDGLVAWNIPVGFKEPNVSAIISIRDEAGNEALHRINFDVVERPRGRG